MSSIHTHENVQIRRGPWTVEEDSILVHYTARYGEGRWNHLAKSSGLKRTGRSCRLRWLNYLKPDVKRGNLSPEEHTVIIELHSKWGNRWSRIAKQLPGRTDNEIKNYWRTRVQNKERKHRNDPPHTHVNTNPNSYHQEEDYFWSELYWSSMFSSSSTAQDNAMSDGFWSMNEPWEIQILNVVKHPVP